MEDMGGGGLNWGKVGDWMSEVTDRGRDDYWKERSENQLRSNMEWNAATQREFAQYGIRWKMADAMAAGVHPLYAIGGSGATFSPGASVSEGGAQSHGRGAGGQLYESAAERQLRMEQIEAVRAGTQKDVAMASYYDAQAAVERQKLNPGPRALLANNPGDGGQGQGVTVPSWDATTPLNSDAVQLSGDPMPSSRSDDRSMGAAPGKPFWSEYQVTPNLKMALPWTQEGPGEALENVSWWMWPSVLMMNKQRYGSGWLGNFYREVVLGQENNPVFRQHPSGWNKSKDAVANWPSGRERGVNWRRTTLESPYRWNVK